MEKRQIFGVGETVFDVIFKNDKPVAAVPGGSAFNSLISLGRSVGVRFPEIPIRMITETGDDHIGDIVVRFMQENNVNTQCVTRNNGTQTHISMAFLDERNDAKYEFYKDHAHASLKEENLQTVDFHAEDILITSSFFAINPVIRDYTANIYRKAYEAGAIIYYDVNFRSSHAHELPAVMTNVIENCRLSDIVRGSTEDFNILFGTSNPQEVYDKHLKNHCKLFICTDGANPLTLITPTVAARYSAKHIETVSTIGAGDNFNAGIICGIVENNLTKAQLNNADKRVWDKLIAKGQEFSAEVCQSVFNYIGG
ncbi:MAG: carbohydrate kinase [Bacteroidaceae bacterium]|nr:carbohydrate kinase [Bacteroidaceae bacterium]